MSWAALYSGNGVPRDVTWPEPPPWRTFPRTPDADMFQPPPGLIDAVNAALCLRRPLLITGPAGSGKSTLIDSVAAELQLGRVLRWHITSRSTLADALYQYDVLGRIHAQQLGQQTEIGKFMRLGPLGTALCPSQIPRALLIDEIDKSDLDLPSDLLNVLERGEFDIAELARYEDPQVMVRTWEDDDRLEITRGRVRCTTFPFIVMTSNGERDFPAAFLRRCVRFTMPTPTADVLGRIVAAHLGTAALAGGDTPRLIETFLARISGGEQLAIDQLLNAVFLLNGEPAPQGKRRDELEHTLMHELSGA